MSRNWLVEQINKCIENNMKPLEAKKKKKNSCKGTWRVELKLEISIWTYVFDIYTQYT